ncbi:hypothetical protein [Terasakiella sp. SH-1]|uniref:hypothetical protein n=1 Tax=Terasakiella sp. SH-1 TaxID=2560057 RepID=UPI0010736438|nr:hypothetical protein [Terasakiella sp. SH-1]
MLSATYAFWTFFGTAVLIQAVDEKHNITVRRKVKDKKKPDLLQKQGAQGAAQAFQPMTEKEREMLKQVQAMENDLNTYREQKLTEMNGALEEQKKRALAEVMDWSVEEKKRLEERFNQDYQSALAGMRNEVVRQIDDEFEQIIVHFEEMAVEDKTMAQNQIREFLEKKKKKLVSSLG